MRAKLRDGRGETLVEVLASVLICALSVALLFGSVMASANIDLKTRELDQQYYEDLTKAERQGEADMAPNTGPLSAGASVKVKNSGSGKERLDLNIKFYGTERMLSYASS